MRTIFENKEKLFYSLNFVYEFHVFSEQKRRKKESNIFFVFFYNKNSKQIDHNIFEKWENQFSQLFFSFFGTFHNQT